MGKSVSVNQSLRTSYNWLRLVQIVNLAVTSKVEYVGFDSEQKMLDPQNRLRVEKDVVDRWC